MEKFVKKLLRKLFDKYFTLIIAPEGRMNIPVIWYLFDPYYKYKVVNAWFQCKSVEWLLKMVLIHCLNEINLWI